MADTAHKLWDHQYEGLEKLRASARKGIRTVILQAPPGSGKTEVAVEITKGALAKGNSVAFTVPLLNLVDQAAKRFQLRGIDTDNLGVMQARHPLTREGAPVQLISVQTLASRKVFPNASIVLVDEAHIQFSVIRKWMEAHPEILFIGLSATPWSVGLGDYWQDLQIVSTIPEMQAAGVLTPYLIYAPPLTPDLSGVKTVAGDYAVGALSERMREKTLTADIVSTWLSKGEGRPTLVFCVDRDHAKALNAQFEEAGVRSTYVDALTPSDERLEYMAGLESGAVKIVCSIGTMTTGIDLPVVSCISYCRPTKSPILYVQSLTRGLRAYPGKQNCLILDHSTSSHRLMSWLGEVPDFKLLPGKVDKDAVPRETPSLPLPRVCEACNYFIPAKTPRCPNCGAVPVRRTSIQPQKGELVEITRDAIDTGPSKQQTNANRHWSPEAKRQFFAELKGHAAHKGYAPGWAANKYKTKFGVWPNAYKDARPIWPPSLATAEWIRGQMLRFAIARQGGLRHAR